MSYADSAFAVVVRNWNVVEQAPSFVFAIVFLSVIVTWYICKLYFQHQLRNRAATIENQASQLTLLMNEQEHSGSNPTFQLDIRNAERTSEDMVAPGQLRFPSLADDNRVPIGLKEVYEQEVARTLPSGTVHKPSNPIAYDLWVHFNSHPQQSYSAHELYRELGVGELRTVLERLHELEWAGRICLDPDSGEQKYKLHPRMIKSEEI